MRRLCPCFGSSAVQDILKDKYRSKSVDHFIEVARRTDERILKILLLGPGESGKSTLFKQLLMQYGKGYNMKQRVQYTASINRTIFSAIQSLIQASDLLPPELNCKMSPALGNARKYFSTIGDGDSIIIDPEFELHLMALWVNSLNDLLRYALCFPSEINQADEGIQNTYKNRALFQLNDSTEYFFNDIHRIASDEYMPTDADILRTRTRTTGIQETTFTMPRGIVCTMIDVGGQRTERKKWIACFDDSAAIFFVVSMSEYNQFLYEDETMNRTLESLKLFDETVNNPVLSELPIILFLNKKDLFLEKIKTFPLSDLFPEYKGGSDFENAADFITQQFLFRKKNKRTKVYVYQVSATDKDNVKKVFDSIVDILMRQILNESGLLG